MNALRISLLAKILWLQLVTFLSFSASGQVCLGSLGDPTVNITFNTTGVNTTLAPGYTYTPNVCPDDGYYTVTNLVTNCFGNSWAATSDHTGDGSGFMLVNASFNPGDFFVSSVSDLCPNTTYEFAAWITNVMVPSTGIRPNLTFRIETPSGTVLQEFSTGNIGLVGQWNQYGLFFTTPPDNPVIVLRITNNAPGGYGNDLALDDITFRPCGPMVQAVIQGYGDTVDICVGDNSSYTFGGSVSAGYQSPVYQWQNSIDNGLTWKDIPGANTLAFLRVPAAAPSSYLYRLTVTDARVSGLTSCRIGSNVVAINVHPNPIVDAGPDRILLAGRSITLTGHAEGENVTYSWIPGTFMSDPTILNPTIAATSALYYTLNAESEFGCINKDEVYVKVVAGIFVPNAFTPNNDGKNDTWEIPYLDPSFGAEVNVFNRWGQLVYRSIGTTVSWDGTINGIPQGSGTYVYSIHSKEHSIKLKGTLTLLR
jgi:gliding motility-associated-like protein